MGRPCAPKPTGTDSAGSPHGVYVGASRYKPAERFDQHKAGIRAAGSVLKRGLEVLVGPVLHLQGEVPMFCIMKTSSPQRRQGSIGLR